MLFDWYYIKQFISDYLNRYHFDQSFIVNSFIYYLCASFEDSTSSTSLTSQHAHSYQARSIFGQFIDLLHYNFVFVMHF